MGRQIINKNELLDTLSPDVVDFALEQFHKAELEDGMIISNYDADGYCTFEHLRNEIYEFIGTAK